MALADVFDALISKRVYKEEWTEDRVLDEIRAQSGKQFDPVLVDVFRLVKDRFEKINSEVFVE